MEKYKVFEYVGSYGNGYEISPADEDTPNWLNNEDWELVGIYEIPKEITQFITYYIE